MYYDHEVGGWASAGMGVGVLLFCGLVLTIVVAVVLASSDRSAYSAPIVESASPQNILDARFARGEIDATEYRAQNVILQEGSVNRGERTR